MGFRNGEAARGDHKKEEWRGGKGNAASTIPSVSLDGMGIAVVILREWNFKRRRSRSLQVEKNNDCCNRGFLNHLIGSIKLLSHPNGKMWWLKPVYVLKWWF